VKEKQIKKNEKKDLGGTENFFYFVIGNISGMSPRILGITLALSNQFVH